MKDIRKRHPWIYWTPRILSIMFILFLAMFSLDVFEGGYSFWGTILGLVIHNIPPLILLAILVVSWKHEVVGAVTYILAGILYIIMIFINNFEWHMLSWPIIISGPAFFIGILYWINWKLKKKQN